MSSQTFHRPGAGAPCGGLGDTRTGHSPWWSPWRSPPFLPWQPPRRSARDPFTQATCAASTTTNHHTEVEPDTFSNGSTIVAAFQVGRVFDGGACAIGFATSTNNGASWTNGLLPGITKWTSSQGVANGPNDRATDAAVAYDAKHGVWLISSLTLAGSGRGPWQQRGHQPLHRWSHLEYPLHHRHRRAASTRTGLSVTTRPAAPSTATATPNGTTTATATSSR